MKIEGFELQPTLPLERISRRRQLLCDLQTGGDLHVSTHTMADFQRYREQAYAMLQQGAGEWLDLNREPAAIRDRYGRTMIGQSLLMARRLIEAGVSLVQVHWANPDKAKPNGGGWDTHEKHSESLKGWLMPVLDQVYSAVLEDLSQRGMLEETLVCLISEFGHTPKINAKAGRDHWGRVFSIALAGGGIRGGVVHGSTDRNAGEPLTDPVRPADYLATVYHCLGYDPDTLVYDVENRPIPISSGRVISDVLA